MFVGTTCLGANSMSLSLLLALVYNSTYLDALLCTPVPRRPYKIIIAPFTSLLLSQHGIRSAMARSAPLFILIRMTHSPLVPLRCPILITPLMCTLRCVKLVQVMALTALLSWAKPHQITVKAPSNFAGQKRRT